MSPGGGDCDVVDARRGGDEDFVTEGDGGVSGDRGGSGADDGFICRQVVRLPRRTLIDASPATRLVVVAEDRFQDGDVHDGRRYVVIVRTSRKAPCGL